MILDDYDLSRALNVTSRAVQYWRDIVARPRITPLPFYRDLQSGAPRYDTDQVLNWLETFRPKKRYAKDLRKFLSSRGSK